MRRGRKGRADVEVCPGGDKSRTTGCSSIICRPGSQEAANRGSGAKGREIRFWEFTFDGLPALCRYGIRLALADFGHFGHKQKWLPYRKS